MADPLTLAALGSVAIVEGIKFLYGQVGELLKRRREEKEKAEASTGEPAAAAPPVARMEIEVPPAMGGKRFEVDANLRVVDDNADRMARLRGELANYADETLEVDAGNEALLRTVAELRDLVEESIGAHLTFAGEGGRPATGSPLAVGRVRVGHFRGGAATGLRADEFTAGSATGEVDVDVAEQGSTLTGAQFGRIGPASPRPEPPG